VPSPRLSPKIAKLLTAQLLLTCLAMLGALAFLLYHTRPNQMGTTGGIDPINTFVTWMAFVVVFGALIAIQLIFARQTRSEANGERRGVKSW
jgi:TRAP-type C4-dicarboxylate transport system permease small subunit